MKILLVIMVVPSLSLLIFARFIRVAGLRVLALRQRLTVYRRKSKKAMLKNGDRLFRSLVSKIWGDWTPQLILVKPETVIWLKIRAETIEASAAFMALKASNGIRYVQHHQSGPNFRDPRVVRGSFGNWVFSADWVRLTDGDPQRFLFPDGQRLAIVTEEAERRS